MIIVSITMLFITLFLKILLFYLALSENISDNVRYYYFKWINLDAVS